MINIEPAESVNEDLILEAERIENNPKMMLALVDLLFLGREDTDIPS